MILMEEDKIVSGKIIEILKRKTIFPLNDLERRYNIDLVPIIKKLLAEKKVSVFYTYYHKTIKAYLTRFTKEDIYWAFRRIRIAKKSIMIEFIYYDNKDLYPLAINDFEEETVKKMQNKAFDLFYNTYEHLKPDQNLANLRKML
jgi:hypothetical protein